MNQLEQICKINNRTKKTQKGKKKNRHNHPKEKTKNLPSLI